MFNQLSNIVLLEPVQNKDKVQKTWGKKPFMLLIHVLGGACSWSVTGAQPYVAYATPELWNKDGIWSSELCLICCSSRSEYLGTEISERNVWNHAEMLQVKGDLNHFFCLKLPI